MKLDSWEPQTLTGNQHKLDSLKIGDSHELFENILFRLKCFFIYLFKKLYSLEKNIKSGLIKLQILKIWFFDNELFIGIKVLPNLEQA